MNVIASSNQDIRFSGAGAAHSNGVSERGIQHITRMARTMMLHAALRSPQDTITANLWSMAMDYAVWVWNRIPNRVTGMSPLELWTRSVSEITRQSLANAHVWGCAAYVLEPRLQKPGVKIPKWMPRSRRGVFVGFSPEHSSLVGLVLNISSRAITPCFHLVFDDLFSTAHCNDSTPPSAWTDLITSRFSRIQNHFDDDKECPLDEVWNEHDKQLSDDNMRRRSQVITGQPNRHQPLVEREETHVRSGATTMEDQDAGQETHVRSEATTMEEQDARQPIQRETPSPTNRICFRDNISRVVFDPGTPQTDTSIDPTPTTATTPAPTATPAPTLRRSTRTSKPVKRYTDDAYGPHSKWKTSNVKAMVAILKSYEWKPKEWDRISALLALIDHPFVRTDGAFRC